MNTHPKFDGLEVGYDIPALPRMAEADIQTPCLILDLDALERNIKKMGDYAKAHGMRHRVHGKMHKSVDVAKLQETLGGSCGVCCQKVSEAEVFARGGIKDVLVSNQVRDPAKIDRLARLPKWGTRTIVCVDMPDNVAAAPGESTAGSVVICEDGADRQYLRILRPDGTLSTVGANTADNTELAGACFSPAGSVLFVNVYGSSPDPSATPARTLAVLGPWSEVLV